MIISSRDRAIFHQSDFDPTDLRTTVHVESPSVARTESSVTALPRYFVENRAISGRRKEEKKKKKRRGDTG